MNLDKLIGTTQEVISFSGAVVRRKIQKDDNGFWVNHRGCFLNVEWDERFNKFALKSTPGEINEERENRGKKTPKGASKATTKSEGELLKEYHEKYGTIKHFKF